MLFIFRLDKCLQALASGSVAEVEHTPVWASKGEGFDPRGARAFVETMLKFVRDKRRSMRAQVAKMRKTHAELEASSPHRIGNAQRSQRMAELDALIDQLVKQMDELAAATSRLEAVLASLQALCAALAETGGNGLDTLYRHIKQVQTSDQIFGGLASKGLNLKCALNGTELEFDVFFNLRDWSTSNSADPDTQHSHMHQLVAECQRVINRHTQCRNVRVARLLDEAGDELRTVIKLVGKEPPVLVWALQVGETWRPHKQLLRALKLNVATLVVRDAPFATSISASFQA